MSTIQMECPKCGAPGKVPRNKVQTRLVCRKCLAIFHLTPVGRAVLGEPPTTTTAKEDSKSAVGRASAREPVEFEFSMPKAPVLVGALALLLVLLLAVNFGLIGWGGDSGLDVVNRATTVAQALADQNIDRFKAATLPGTETEAIQFFEKARAGLNMVRRRSPTSTIQATAQLQESAENQSRVRFLAVFMPNLGTARQQQITGVDAVPESEGAAALATLWFVRDNRGRWCLDGKSCTELTTTH
jgi:hypothetical protein